MHWGRGSTCNVTSLFWILFERYIARAFSVKLLLTNICVAQFLQNFCNTSERLEGEERSFSFLNISLIKLAVLCCAVNVYLQFWSRHVRFLLFIYFILLLLFFKCSAHAQWKNYEILLLACVHLMVLWVLVFLAQLTARKIHHLSLDPRPQVSENTTLVVFATIRHRSRQVHFLLLFVCFLFLLDRPVNKHHKTKRREQCGGLSQQYRPRAF